jgi:PHD-finger
MASKDGKIADFEKRGKKRPNHHPMPPIHEDCTKDDHAADVAHDNKNNHNNNWEQQEQQTMQSTGCLVCGVDDDHANMLLCEECNGEFHTYCLTPKLDTVPEYDWFCGASCFLY